MTYTLPIPEELVEEIARRAAEILRAEESPDVSPWMDVKTAAEYLGWPVKRLYNLTSAKAVPCRKHEGRIMFHRDELDAWLEDFREGPALRPSASSCRLGADLRNGPATRQRPGPGNGKRGSDAAQE